jgi:hypothetical protein
VRQCLRLFGLRVDRSGEVWTTAEIKIGRELAKMPKAKPSGSNQHKDRSHKGTDPATLKELGVSKP